ncbi:hypothetical protein ACP4OV_008625 [Aristida adscensionis]
MDPEQTFLRVHARLSGMLSQLLTPRIRLALEYLYLAGAVALFCLLVVMHTNFVQQPGCSSEFSGIEFGEAQLVQIKIISGGLWASRGASYIMDLQNLGRSAEKILEVNGDKFNILASKFWSAWVGPGARRSKLMFRTWKGDKEFEPQSDNAADTTVTTTIPGVPDFKATGEGSVHHPLSAKESFKAALTYLFRKWYFRIVSFWRNIKLLSENTLQLVVRSNWNDFFHILKDVQLPSMDHLLSSIGNVCSILLKFSDDSVRNDSEGKPFIRFLCWCFNYIIEEKCVLSCTAGASWLDAILSGLVDCSGLREEAKPLNLPIYMAWRRDISCFQKGPKFAMVSEPSISQFLLEIRALEIGWQQLLINSIVGYDTILTNSLVNSPGHGYLYNFQTKELYDLSYGHEPPEGPTRFGDYFVTKCGVLLMSLFVFFTTTMSVSFTLRETQSRMLRFTVQLQHHARHQLPTFQLIFVHVIESLVFVPIMIGILFFLFEFYDDQLLAFLVLTLVWLCELFTMISCADIYIYAVLSALFLAVFPGFPHLLLFIYLWLLIPGFLCYGRIHAASDLIFLEPFRASENYFVYTTCCTAIFEMRSSPEFRVPALQRFIRSRAHIHQQTGVQITSSTIYTSTLHIARVNVRDPGTINDGLGAAREADTLLVQDDSIRNQQGVQQNGNAEPPGDNPLQYQDQNPQQAGNAPAGSGSLNPFGSLLLWLLGGGASDGIVSFFSMFRDVRDHGQDYNDPPRNESDQVT